MVCHSLQTYCCCTHY
ncbi:hypothetical protein LH672_13970 [Acinetobacter pittii]|nr:hypothetical protein [Acinetobacter pittii]MCF1281949.1 hypothetical protein [Acinetobacter pittii]